VVYHSKHLHRLVTFIKSNNLKKKLRCVCNSLPIAQYLLIYLFRRSVKLDFLPMPAVIHYWLESAQAFAVYAYYLKYTTLYLYSPRFQVMCDIFLKVLIELQLILHCDSTFQ